MRGVPSTIACAWALVIDLTCHPAHADGWWGADKAMHFAVSAAVAGGTYRLTSTWVDSRTARCFGGVAAALAVGTLKEAYDGLGHGDPSWRDFTWDVAGAVVGTTLAYAVDHVVSEPRHEHRYATVAPAALTVVF